MTLPSEPPRYPTWGALVAPVVYKERGWRVYALEKGIRFERDKPENLGVFNTALKDAVKAYQANHDLGADGIVGPKTWTYILAEAANHADEKVGVDVGTAYGWVVYEGGNTGAATNWDVPGGVDCGVGQRRIYGPPYDMGELKLAFDPRRGLAWAMDRYKDKYHEVAIKRPGFKRGDRHKKIAALHHNAPFLAAQILENRPPKGATFPDDYLDTPHAAANWTYNPSTGGTYTHAQWATEYPRRLLSFTDIDD